ncbi:MAG: hypothetical protein H6832_11835 [Planctomycetes bacterium]|nr:hypothetical protein [Planctomycetota bacterium]MCB9919083.1 hypothetical protein [Planctomycetota bacterium]
MRVRISSFLACIVVACSLQAQRYHVSPIQAATTEGTSDNTFPWASSSMRRYQQIHSDMPSTTMRITTLGFRQNATTSTYTGTRTIDMELSMGRGVVYDRVQLTFDKNYVAGSKAMVIARKKINISGGATVDPGPCPFDGKLEIKLDVPYTYLPSDSLVWDVIIYSNIVLGNFGALDADACPTTLVSATSFGTGCTATGQVYAMSFVASGSDNGGTLGLLFSLSNGPVSAPVLMILGTQQLDLPVTGFCTNLYTDLLLVLPMGATDATGRWFEALVAPNPGAGSLSAQAITIDVGQAGFPLAATNRRTVTIPAPNTTKVLRVTRLTNTDNVPTATKAMFFSTSSVGYGLVTRFTY